MDGVVSVINKLMVEVFNDILTIEETALKNGKFSDVTVTEVHTIEAIGMYSMHTASEVAKKLNITGGTLTVAIKNLVEKDYVLRVRSEDDRRVVKLGLTNKGRLLYRVHELFHEKMIKAAIDSLSVDEEKILASALSKLHQFLLATYIEK